MYFEIIGDITAVATIAKGRGVRTRRQLSRTYGAGAWRKRKGVGRVRLANGDEHTAEIHWYEAHGIGKKDLKIKRLLD